MIRAHMCNDGKRARRWFFSYDNLVTHEYFRLFSIEAAAFKRGSYARLGVGFGGDCGGDVTFGLTIPYIFTFYLTLNLYFMRRILPEGKTCAIWITGLVPDRDYDGTGIRIEPWSDESWESGRSWWRNGVSFNFSDFLFGRRVYDRRTIQTSTRRIKIPNYKEYGTALHWADVEITVDSWKRPRWPRALRLVRTTVTPNVPVPIPGKGENSWDCGEDSRHSETMCHPTVSPDAILAGDVRELAKVKDAAELSFVRGIMKTRQERG